MSYEAKQAGLQSGRFGTPAGFLTGGEAALATEFFVQDADATECVNSGLTIRAQSQYAANGDPVVRSHAYFGVSSYSVGQVTQVIIGVGGTTSAATDAIFLTRVLPATTESGELVTMASSTPMAIFQGNACQFYANGTNRVQITNSSPYAFKTAGGVWGTTSDERLKQNIRPISDAIGKLNALKPCHYEFKNSGELLNPQGTRTGFIAQEFEQVLPGHTFEVDPAFDADKATLGEGVKAKGLEADLVPYLVKAVQELSAKVTALETQLAALQA